MYMIYWMNGPPHFCRAGYAPTAEKPISPGYEVGYAPAGAGCIKGV
jgi:hypothetical protein